MKDEKTKLKFFGIGRILPFLKKFRGQIALMVLCGLGGSLTDIILPQFQRYALDHFVVGKVFDTIAMFLILYVLTILFAAGTNYISCALATIIEVRVNRELRQTGIRRI